MGELGPFGHSGTRFEMEVDGQLSAAGVLEMAWMTGLVHYEHESRGGSWIDAETGESIAEEDIAARYREQVTECAGIRWVEPESVGFDPQRLPVLASVYLEKDFSFTVSSEEEARVFAMSDPEHTKVAKEGSVWKVTRLAGTEIRVPREARLQRNVAGVIPKGFDFAKYGISQDMIDNTDPVALFNIVSTVGAFMSAGLTPEELLRWIHPARVANTQGAGIGGMRSLHKLYLDHYLGEERQQDILQETLINVAAAHVVQSYVGSYGAMSHPVAACATAAISLEEGFDKILAGKADFVVAGGFDDIGREGMVGFGDMHATANTDELTEMGFAPVQMSRPNDRRRKGFVESQGGGTLLLARADMALKMGLPITGVLGYAGSFSDGLQKSIPAPGLGALASAVGGTTSPLGEALTRFGLTADDIGIVSKHDTSTMANDRNENTLHQQIQQALGRTVGNPLFVISQKSLTGHSKGGAAAWQSIGLLQAMHQGMVPGNRNVEDIEAATPADCHLSFSDKPLRLGASNGIKAGLLTSLGFGHVSGIVLLMHPEVLFAKLSATQQATFKREAAHREQVCERRWSRVLLGMEQAYEKRSHRRFASPDGSAAQTAEESAMLLAPSARLDEAKGVFSQSDV
jgi:fatty acid synthase